PRPRARRLRCADGQAAQVAIGIAGRLGRPLRFGRGQHGLHLHHRGREQIAAACDRLDDCLRLVFERGPDVADALHQRIVGDEDAGPQRLDQFVLGHHPPRVARKIEQHVEGFGPQWEMPPLRPAARRVGIELEAAKLQDFLGERRHLASDSRKTCPNRAGLSLLSALFQRSFTTAKGPRASDRRAGAIHAPGPTEGEEPMITTGLRCRCTGLALVLSAAVAGAARADAIIDWNAKAEMIAVEKRMLAPPNARIMAMMHIAMFEAVNAIEHRYAPYKLTLAADRGTSKDAGAATAAHGVLLAVHPDQQASLDSALRASLAAIADGEPKARGIELGRKAAAGIIALRADDGANAPESYRPVTATGVYVPTVIPVSSTDGAVKPWTMTSGSQFRPAPPPALDSDVWTKDLNEIREV